MEFGPDGCLYIADWYNKVISHNEVSREHPDRDRKHGRIWRIRHKSQKALPVPNFYKMPTAELAKHLKSDSLWAKRAAWHQIADRQAKELIPQLIKIAEDKNADEISRIHAVWSLESLKHYDQKLMNALMVSTESNLRREAVRALAHLPLNPDELAKQLKLLKSEKNVMVRSQVLRTIEEYGKANNELIDLLVSFCLPDLPGPVQLGKTYERKFERYLARKALEKYPSELKAYLGSDLAKGQVASHITWASQALPKDNREEVFLAEWNKSANKKIDETKLLIIAPMLRNPKVLEAVKDSFNDPSLIPLVLKHQSKIQSKELSLLLKPAVSELLKSETPSQALDTAVNFKITGLDKGLLRIIKESKIESDIIKALQALSYKGKVHAELFAEITHSNKSFTIRHSAFKALLQTDSQRAEKIFSQF